MPFDPFVAKLETPAPAPGGWWSKLPHPRLGPRGTKLLIAISAGVIILSMLSFALFSYLAVNKKFSQDHGLTANDQQAQDEASKSQLALPGGNAATGSGGTSGVNPPDVTLVAEPASVAQGGTVKLRWKATNSPKRCTASEDWSGDKTSSGDATSPVLDKLQTYLFTLTCYTDKGTGFSTVKVGTIAQGGTGNAMLRPTVVLAANPSGIFVGDLSALTWSTTNAPTSCTASGDWSGVKSPNGSENTPALTAAKQYTYTLTCSNAAGQGYATTKITAATPPADIPIVMISSTPSGPVTPGTPITLSWSVSNSPTSCTASDDWAGGRGASGSERITTLTSIRTYAFTLTCSNSAGATKDTANIAVVPNPPSVAIGVSPNTITAGQSATLTWSSTNSPTSCTASGDWSGSKASSGTASTGTLGTARSYTYHLVCQNPGGTSATETTVLTVVPLLAPVVSLSANPIATVIGGSANLTWSATNSPTSCTASGDWSGSKASSGTASTGTLSTARAYNYSLGCTNASGSNTASTSVSVSSGTVSSPPVVSISAAPTTVAVGATTTLSWSATNSPTSCAASGGWSGSKSAAGSATSPAIVATGTTTYTLTCTNAAGSSSGSASVTGITAPTVSISAAPTSVQTGSASTISWSSTNATTCTASGAWSGSKGLSGSQSSGTIATAGSYVYSLTCTNAGGSATQTTTVTATDPAPVYCGGLTPCYGPSDLAQHATPGNCWGWNGNWVINITSFRPSHKGGIKASSTSTLENAAATCNHDINAILRGQASIPGYMDAGGATTHSHGSATTNNTGSSLLLGYRVGYYDATKP